MKLKRKQVLQIQAMTKEELATTKEELAMTIHVISMIWSYAHPLPVTPDSGKVTLDQTDTNATDRHNYLCRKYGPSCVWVAHNIVDFYHQAAYAENEAKCHKNGIVLALIRNGVIEREEHFT